MLARTWDLTRIFGRRLCRANARPHWNHLPYPEKVVAVQEFIFRFGRRPVLARRVPLIGYTLTVADKRLGTLK
jgi:hypothetical protein